MRTVHFISIIVGITVFAITAGLLSTALSPAWSIVLGLVLSLNAGWIVACPKTVAQFYADTAHQLFGRKANGEWAVGLTAIVYGLVCITSCATFVYGHYWALTEFWDGFAWHQQLFGNFDIYFRMSKYGFYAMMAAVFTFALLLCFGLSEGFQHTFGKSSRERVMSTLKVVGVVVTLSLFNHFLWAAAMAVMAITIGLMVAAIALVMLVASIRLAGEQRLASVTVGIIVGDIVSWGFVGFAVDLPSLLTAIVVGSIAGFIAGEFVHRTGLLFIQRDWKIELF